MVRLPFTPLGVWLGLHFVRRVPQLVFCLPLQPRSAAHGLQAAVGRVQVSLAQLGA